MNILYNQYSYIFSDITKPFYNLTLKKYLNIIKYSSFRFINSFYFSFRKFTRFYMGKNHASAEKVKEWGIKLTKHEKCEFEYQVKYKEDKGVDK